MTALRKISGVEFGTYGDPVTWKDPCSPLILVVGDDISHANTVTEKRDLVRQAQADGGLLIFPWVGQYRTDASEVDDLQRPLDGLASPTGRMR